MLRASSQVTGEDVNLNAVNGDGGISGIAGGEALIAFAEAAVTGTDTELDGARDALVSELGEAAMVDAAGVVSNFERMVRIADATGIPLGDGLEAFSEDIRNELDLERFVRVKANL